ncbi:MAG: BlaI/MecI/CopY family transcriptional regulator [Thermoanaerobaculia bacterium]
MPDLPRPTPTELILLRALWTLRRGTVREVHEAVGGDAFGRYTTVLKLLQIMTEKGLVERDESQRAHVYRPVVAAERTQRQLVRDLVDRAFAGSTARLVQQALSARHPDAEELAEIRRLLDSLEGDDR